MNNIDILKPQCRLDDLWVRVITKNDVDLPLPQSRLELYVTALITGNIDNLPYPQSRVEMLLYCILTDTEYTFNAQSRVEMFLKAIITLDIEGLPTPMSRLEWYLDYIVRNGCLEKYEYYPFTIRDYLNVKNTPKARMKFKGMKGNTLVNIWDINTIQKQSQVVREVDFIKCMANSIYITPTSKDKSRVKPNTDYTVIYNITKNTLNTSGLITLNNDYNAESCLIGDWSIKSGETGVLVKKLKTRADLSSCIHLLRTQIPNHCIDGEFIFNCLIVEGDYTQSPPSYFEGMLSFGESENKIEVLSVGKNLFDVTKYNSLDKWDSRGWGPNYLTIQDYTFNFKAVNGWQAYMMNFDFKLNEEYNLKFKARLKETSTTKSIIKIGGFYSNDFYEGISIATGITPSNTWIEYSLTFIPKFKQISFVNVITPENQNHINELLVKDIQIKKSNLDTEYKPYEEIKAIPMYRNANNELVPVPILRGKWEDGRFLWGDEIILHDDGNLYYHKRCFVKIFDSTEEWGSDINATKTIRFRVDTRAVDNSQCICNKYHYQFNDNDIEHCKIGSPRGAFFAYVDKSKLETQDIAGFKKLLKKWYDEGDPLTVIMQLAKEEVYPCELSEQLYSYDNETNIFINGGAVVGETVIEVGTKLGPIVAEIKQETLRNARAVEGLLAHGVQEMAYQLYPDDFNTTGDIEKR